jgi:NAD(P)H-hydrate repair Nnr-like enzyme with NAD(P)H-hydrate dehydratase domain
VDKEYWIKQAADKPLFGDLVWSRPENAAHAGKLLIVGGNLYGFNNPALAYTEAGKAGIGVARVLLPDALQKTVGKVFEAGEYGPSTPSGSFSTRALAEVLPMAAWADGVLLSGDFGRNSETAILLEKFAAKYSGPLTISCDAADYFTSAPQATLGRADTAWVISFAQLQKLAMHAKYTAAFTFDMDFLRLIDMLHDFTALHQTHIITKHLDTIFVASNGQVSSTRLHQDMGVWRLKTASHAAVWWLQNPSKPFQALTTGVSSMLGKVR